MKISVTEAATKIVRYRDSIGHPIPVPDIPFKKMSLHENSFKNELKKKKDCQKTTTK